MPLIETPSGATMWIEDKGEGKPILFVHGWPLSGKPWRNQLEGMSHEHRVLTVDLPGFAHHGSPEVGSALL